MTLVGGPTALIEAGGFRLLTDPTFDPPGDYPLPHVTLHKTSGPALSAREIGPIDAVLLSHDQHSHNLDHSGKAFLSEAGRVLTTRAGAQRLGGRTEGLAPWETKKLTGRSGHVLEITATPARHGPAGIEPFSGDVIGFMVSFPDQAARPIYVTGDTVWYDGVADLSSRRRVVVCRRCTDARPVPSHHEHERRNRGRAPILGRNHCSRASRGLGAFHPERGGPGKILQRAWLRRPATVAQTRGRDED
jgi:hypothetical protein